MSFEGLLNNTCTILKRTVTQDATSRQRVETWIPVYAGVRCRLDEAKGGEFAAESSILAKSDHVLFMKYAYAIQPGEHRIKIGTKQYNVLLVKNAGGQFHHYELFLERFNNAS